MADHLDLAIRIRADLQSALSNLDRMEKGVRGLGGEMKRASAASRIFGATIGQLVTGDLLARGMTSIARAARQMASDTGRTGIEAQLLAASVRAATGDADSAAKELAFVARETDRLGTDLAGAESAFVKLTATTRGTALVGTATRDVFTAVAEAARAIGLSAEQQISLLHTAPAPP